MNNVQAAKLKYIDAIEQQSKDIVSGYLRINALRFFMGKENAYFVIAPLIHQLCLLFWYEEMGTFDVNLCGKYIEIFNEKKSAKHQCKSMEYCSVYGAQTIPSMIDREYVWRLRIIGPECERLHIGIDSGECTNSYFRT